MNTFYKIYNEINIIIFSTILLVYVSHTHYSVYGTPQDLQSEARLGRVISDHYSDSSNQLPRPFELCLVVNETCLENLQRYQMNIYYLLWFSLFNFFKLIWDDEIYDIYQNY